MNDLVEKSLEKELYREYDFCDRLYKIDKPVKLFYREGGSTHRVVDRENVVHCLPAPGFNGCVLRWKGMDEKNPVQF
jgi:hypothetical protein